jgi:hypothetical protein
MYPPARSTLTNKSERQALLRPRPSSVDDFASEYHSLEKNNCSTPGVFLISPRSIIVADETQGALFFIPPTAPSREAVQLHPRVSDISHALADMNFRGIGAPFSPQMDALSPLQSKDRSFRCQSSPLLESSSTTGRREVAELAVDGDIPEMLFLPFE